MDRFEPTGPAKVGSANESRPGKRKPARQTKAGPAKRKPARQTKAGPANKSRPGKQKPARQKKKPVRQSRAGRVWKRAALLVQTSQWANIARSAFPFIQMRLICKCSC